MKPHIWKKDGIWRCWLLNRVREVGLGYTPEEAHDDWERLVLSTKEAT